MPSADTTTQLTRSSISRERARKSGGEEPPPIRPYFYFFFISCVGARRILSVGRWPSRELQGVTRILRQNLMELCAKGRGRGGCKRGGRGRDAATRARCLGSRAQPPRYEDSRFEGHRRVAGAKVSRSAGRTSSSTRPICDLSDQCRQGGALKPEQIQVRSGIARRLFLQSKRCSVMPANVFDGH